MMLKLEFFPRVLSKIVAIKGRPVIKRGLRTRYETRTEYQKTEYVTKLG